MIDARFLPTTIAERDALGWEWCDVIIVTGDAYVDHPSFGAAVIGQMLRAHGFKVGIIPQPDIHRIDDFRVLGRPRLFWGITAGNMDSMVSNYTSEKRIRSDDAYSPNNEAGLRPDRATIAYSNCCKQAYKGVPIVLGGVEASLRRFAHYDYWSDKLRASILLDAKADLLLYGNAEYAVVQLARRLAAGENIKQIRDLPGSVFWQRHVDNISDAEQAALKTIQLPAFAAMKQDKKQFMQAALLIAQHSFHEHGKALTQLHDNRDVVALPPPSKLSSEQMDAIYELPYARMPHPRYAKMPIPAFEMIRYSVIAMRGCPGGCSFCAINAHEGRMVQSRSKASILQEITQIAKIDDSWKGVVSDIGGPTANAYAAFCSRPAHLKPCERLSCLHPEICSFFKHDHTPLIQLYKRARKIKTVRHVFIGSGIRHDLTLRNPEYVRELAAHHVSGLLKVAPEHSEPFTLRCMQKPPIKAMEQFITLFHGFSKQAGKKQRLLPYMIASHPGSSHVEMIKAALWLKKNHFVVDQVQTFLPAPMTLATAMYYSGYAIPKTPDGPWQKIDIPRNTGVRRLHKALLRYHDPKSKAYILKQRQQFSKNEWDLIKKLYPDAK